MLFQGGSHKANPLFFMAAVQQKSVPLFSSYTHVYASFCDQTCRYIVLQGGTSSSKTYSVMQRLSKIAIDEPGVKIDAVAMTADSLDVGVITDFKSLIEDSPVLRGMLLKPGLQRGPYRFKNGSIIRFRNLDDGEKAKHGKRDYLFLNECNTIDYSTARQLIKRTAKQVFIDYNPDAEFWVHQEIIPRDDCYFGISNFTHNQFVPDEVVNDLYEDRQRWLDSIVRNEKGEIVEENTFFKNQWEVYGLGLTGVIEGVVYKNVQYVPELPLGLNHRAFGLDFGFANDPTALILAGTKAGAIYGKELIYETGLTTPDIIKRLPLFGIEKNTVGTKGDLIIADSAGADAIAQLQRANYNVVPCVKGPGSVMSGVSSLQAYNIYLTTSSDNWRQERLNYKYKKNKSTGGFSNEPQKGHDHCWDALRYWYHHFYPPKPKKKTRGKRRIGTVRINR